MNNFGYRNGTARANGTMSTNGTNWRVKASQEARRASVAAREKAVAQRKMRRINYMKKQAWSKCANRARREDRVCYRMGMENNATKDSNCTFLLDVKHAMCNALVNCTYDSSQFETCYRDF